MRFVVLYHLKENVDTAKLVEAVTRRAEYEPPATLIEEYFTPCRHPTVISVFETDDANKLLMNSMAWADVFEIQVMPVVQWREGLETLTP
jgi:hypothetical protein